MLAPKMNGIAWYGVINPDSARTCNIAINTLEDWSIRVKREPTIKLKIKEEDTLCT